MSARPEPARRSAHPAAFFANPARVDAARHLPGADAHGPSRLVQAAAAKNREIAEKLVISARTVDDHVSNIFAKLQAPDRVRAVIRARGAGL